MSLLSLFFGLHGRISRRPFWLGAIALAFLSSLIQNAIFPFTRERAALPDPGEISKMPLDEFLRFGTSQDSYVSSALIFAILSAPLAAKRLHDRDKSAWWVPFFYFGPAVLSYGNDASDFVNLIRGVDDGIATLLWGIIDLIRGVGSLAILFWGIFELGFLRGTVGSNRFGPDPFEGTHA